MPHVAPDDRQQRDFDALINLLAIDDDDVTSTENASLAATILSPEIPTGHSDTSSISSPPNSLSPVRQHTPDGSHPSHPMHLGLDSRIAQKSSPNVASQATSSPGKLSPFPLHLSNFPLPRAPVLRSIRSSNAFPHPLRDSHHTHLGIDHELLPVSPFLLSPPVPGSKPPSPGMNPFFIVPEGQDQIRTLKASRMEEMEVYEAEPNGEESEGGDRQYELRGLEMMHMMDAGGDGDGDGDGDGSGSSQATPGLSLTHADSPGTDADSFPFPIPSIYQTATAMTLSRLTHDLDTAREELDSLRTQCEELKALASSSQPRDVDDRKTVDSDDEDQEIGDEIDRMSSNDAKTALRSLLAALSLSAPAVHSIVSSSDPPLLHPASSSTLSTSAPAATEQGSSIARSPSSVADVQRAIVFVQSVDSTVYRRSSHHSPPVSEGDKEELQSSIFDSTHLEGLEERVKLWERAVRTRVNVPR